MPKMRAFLAIELDDALRAAIARLQQNLSAQIAVEAPGGVRISWPPPASLHVTLVFLGDIDERVIEPLRTAVENAVAGFHALHAPIDRLGAFPRAGAPSVLWAGPSEQWMASGEMTRVRELQRAIAGACVPFGVPRDERVFAPHLTLARIRSDQRAVGRALAKSGALARPIDAGDITIASIALMKSDTRPSGAVYSRLWDLPLLT